MSEIAPERLGQAVAEAGLLLASAAAGTPAQDGRFAALVDGVARAVGVAMDAPERLRFGPVMPRAELETLGYFRSFPHLLGSVHCFCGDEAQHRSLVRAREAGGDWTAGQSASDLVMIPAACYPLYAHLARRGEVPNAGYRVEVEAQCFRREPSNDPARLQSFRMKEVVRVAAPETVAAFRDSWLERGLALLQGWGLEGRIEVANDPFFGRAAAVLGPSQRKQALKYELQVVVSDSGRPTACMSANCHLDGFSKPLGLQGADGAEVHTGCVGFGLERVALALVRRHGVDFGAWPDAARALTAG